MSDIEDPDTQENEAQQGDEGDEGFWREALSKLSAGRERRIPFVAQLSASECGLACLSMVLGAHGRDVRLEELRTVLQVEVSGVSAQAILEAARYYRLRARGVSIDVDELSLLPRASILHWGFNHYIVFEKVVRKGVVVLDPALGRRTVGTDEVRKRFTGIALLFEPEDGFETKQGHVRVWRYLLEVMRFSGMWTRLIVLSTVLQLLALAMPIFTGAIVDRVIPRGDRNMLTLLAIGLAAIAAFHFATALIRGQLLIYTRVRLDSKLRLSLLGRMVELPFAFFQLRSSGDLMTRMYSVDAVVNSLTQASMGALLDGATVAFYLVLLAIFSPMLAALVVGLGVLQALLYVSSAAALKEANAQDIEARANASAKLADLLFGIETLKAMGEARRALHNWIDHFSKALNAEIRMGSLYSLVSSLRSMLQTASPALVLVVGTYEVLQGRMGLGEMLALNALASGFLWPLSNLINTAIDLRALSSHAERLDDIQNTARERDKGRLVATPRLSGSVELERVSFRYGPLSPLVLRDVSVRIEPGQFIALVGRSGSGKSTMAMMMVGLFVPTEGRVVYDGVDIATLDLDDVRRQVGVVPQRDYLFRLSVRDNITLLDPSISFERVIQAATRARIHHEILAMPLGYDTPIAEGGSSLSGGQRQRIALARALVREPKILLLDEATSALDSATEREVQRELDALRCTRIVVAHRLSTIIDADLILVIDGGRIMEFGSHAELMDRRGMYSALLSAQVSTTSEVTVEAAVPPNLRRR